MEERLSRDLLLIEEMQDLFPGKVKLPDAWSLSSIEPRRDELSVASSVDVRYVCVRLKPVYLIYSVMPLNSIVYVRFS